MRNVWTIAKREINMYFASPVAYAIGFGVLLVLVSYLYQKRRPAARPAATGGEDAHG